MYKVKTLNAISPVYETVLNMEDYAFDAYAENPDAIMVRSANMHEMDIPESVQCVARAGAGVNNIPLDKLAERGVVVFNSPGANANAVKELVITGMLLASRKVVDGVEWCKTLSGKGAEVEKLVEKGKSQFVGPELQGKTLGVVGLGAIGVLAVSYTHLDVYKRQSPARARCGDRRCRRPPARPDTRAGRQSGRGSPRTGSPASPARR